MKILAVVILSTLILHSQAVVELTADDFEAKTTGTKAMVKFYAPWVSILYTLLYLYLFLT